MKRVGSALRKKSRLVAQNYEDEEATCIETRDPTVQRFLKRIILCLAASIKSAQCYTRDLTQTYVQSRTPLEKDVYIRPPPEMGVQSGQVLKVVNPLYGIL